MAIDTSIRCDYCGQFISFDDLAAGRATNIMVEPDSHFGPEVWEASHNKCDKARADKIEKRQGTR